LRYGAICKTLHVLPRSGGMLDQPASEMLRLEQILNAYNRYDDYMSRKSEVRQKNRNRHEPTVERTEGI
jgi:hypothetical protein